MTRRPRTWKRWAILDSDGRIDVDLITGLFLIYETKAEAKEQVNPKCESVAEVTLTVTSRRPARRKEKR